MSSRQILIFGTFDESMHPRIKVVRQGLQSRGYDLAVHNAPIGVSTAERVDAANSPLKLVTLGLRLMRAWARLIGLRVRDGSAPVVIVGYLGHFDIHLARLLHPRSTLVLDYLISLADATVDREIDGPIRRVLRLVDDLALRQADIVLSDTDEQRALLADHAASKAVTVLVGAPEEWHLPATVDTDALDPARPLAVVFFGLYTPLQGTKVIAEAIKTALDDGCNLRVTMIGIGQDRPAVDKILDGRDEVTLIDWVPSDDLPSVVAAHDVTLGIFADSPKGRRVVPNKVYQGLAANTAVVTSSSEAQRRVLGDSCRLVAPGSAVELADELRRLDGDRALLRTLQDGQAWRPSSVVGPLVDRLGLPAVEPEPQDPPA